MLERLVRLYESMTRHDLIQIVILAAVLYAVLRFLARTCGAGSSIGRGLGLVVVAIVLLAQVVVANLDMTELGIVLDYLLMTFLVGMLIIFQPELRRGLMMLGQSRLWQLLPREQPAPVACLAAAAAALSEEFVGALIVIERTDDLTQFCANGEVLDCIVSESLIRAVFAPKSPLHDGAVIVRNGRLAAAGCQLPLRVRDEDSFNLAGYSLGMRHRAALCTSEETDAVLLVVSEETGRISLAVRGRLEPAPRELLERRLDSVLRSSSEDDMRIAA